MNAIRLLPFTLLLAGCASLGDGRVLTEADFTRVREGMTRDDTARLLGRPGETMAFARLGNQAWSYEFQDAWGYTTRFSVIFGPQGTVTGTASERLNDGGDHGT